MSLPTALARKAGAALAVVALLALALPALTAPRAGAADVPAWQDEPLPYRHSTCDFAGKTITKTDGWQRLSRDLLRIRPSTPGKLLVTVSVDANVSSGAELRIGYRYNGGQISENFFGPANLANHSEFQENRTITAVVAHNGAGFHFDPHIRVNGANGKSATIGARCVTATPVPAE